jgi:hypothetical protein
MDLRRSRCTRWRPNPTSGPRRHEPRKILAGAREAIFDTAALIGRPVLARRDSIRHARRCAQMVSSSSFLSLKAVCIEHSGAVVPTRLLHPPGTVAGTVRSMAEPSPPARAPLRSQHATSARGSRERRAAMVSLRARHAAAARCREARVAHTHVFVPSAGLRRASLTSGKWRACVRERATVVEIGPSEALRRRGGGLTEQSLDLRERGSNPENGARGEGKSS